jgi:hypothetical protein
LYRGPPAFREPEVAEALHLSAEQRQRIRNLAGDRPHGDPKCDPEPDGGPRADDKTRRPA